MKKILLSFILIINVFASDKLLSQTQVNQILKDTPMYFKLEQAIKKKEITKINGLKTDDFYIFQIKTPQGNSQFYMTLDKKYIIPGIILVKKSNTPLIGNFPINKKIVKNGVVFSFGTGKKDLYIVTDPECPFCRKFVKIAKKRHLAKRYRVHILLFPIHKHSMAMNYYILSAPTKKEQVQRFMQTLSGDNSWAKFKPTKAEKEKIKKELEKSQRAVSELNAPGTPVFYDSNFKKISEKDLFK